MVREFSVAPFNGVMASHLTPQAFLWFSGIVSRWFQLPTEKRSIPESGPGGALFVVAPSYPLRFLAFELV